MRSNERLQRILEMRQLGGMKPVAACSTAERASTNDLRLFAFTFAAGFLFTSVFIA